MPDLAVNGLSFRVKIEGSANAPTIMLSNSLGASLEMWDPQVAALMPNYRVVRYDGRGHGKSSVSAGPYSIEQLGKDALGILDSLQIKRVHWCGLSMGGMIGQWVGAHAPERLDKIVLANTTCYYPNPSFWVERIEAVRQGGIAAIADRVIAGWLTADYRDREPSVAAHMKAMLLGTPQAGYIASCEALSKLDQRDLLPMVKSRTLVIAGRHDASTPVKDAEFIRSKIPDAGLKILEAAHISNVEQSQAFSSALLEFLS
jgi:3-oxoadipate enol-lactonase